MKYTIKNKNIEKETPFDLLEYESLINNDGQFGKFYKIQAENEKIEKLSLAEFINAGIDYIKKETHDKNENGYFAQIGSSGDSAQIGSSGGFARIGSSGGFARIGSSGDSAQIGSSGGFAQIGSSGNYARIQMSGDNSIAFACGMNSRVKAQIGTWISLAEYKKNKNGEYIPNFAKSGQIGNNEFKDCFEKTLNPNYFYELINKEFTPELLVDGCWMVILSKRKVENYTIYKCMYKGDFIENSADKNNILYVAQKEDLFAHGETIKQAMNDVMFKYMQSQDVQEHVKRVKEQGFITPYDYRLLTGTCQFGTNRWLENNGFTWKDKKSIEAVIELTKGEFGHNKLVQLLGEN